VYNGVWHLSESRYHFYFSLGERVTIEQRSDGKTPCPCGEEMHARWNWQKINSMCKLATHPAPDDPQWQDIPPQISVPLLSNLKDESSTPGSSHSPPFEESNTPSNTVPLTPHTHVQTDFLHDDVQMPHGVSDLMEVDSPISEQMKGT
jgi:hypothetical protein